MLHFSHRCWTLIEGFTVSALLFAFLRYSYKQLLISCDFYCFNLDFQPSVFIVEYVDSLGELDLIFL